MPFSADGLWPSDVVDLVAPGDVGGVGSDDVQGPDSTRAAYTQGWGNIVAGDEFDYTGDNTTLTSKGWNVYDGPGNGGNGLRVPTAFTVGGGYLRCHGDASMNTGGMDYEPNSNGGYSANYYRVEARMRINISGSPNGGDQYHPVLILWPDGNITWPQGGEYDYAESDVGETTMEAFMHHPSTDESDQSGFNYSETGLQPGGWSQGDWHNYALEWSHTGGLTGYIDGVAWFHDSDSTNTNKMHQTIQLDSFFATGSKMQPADMDVAWFRCYSITGTGSVSEATVTGTGGSGGGDTGTGGGTGGGTGTGTGTGTTGGSTSADGSSGVTTGIESFFAPITYAEQLVTAADLQALPSNVNTLARLTTGKTSGLTPATKPILKLARLATYAMTAGAQTLISWDTEVVDPDGMFAPGTPTLITIQTAGWYWVTLQVSFASGAAGHRQCALFVNGTTDPDNNAAPRDEWTGSTSLAHIQSHLYDHFEPGDVIRAYSLSAASLNSDLTEGGTWLMASWDAPY